jgi:hypothetical protein
VPHFIENTTTNQDGFCLFFLSLMLTGSFAEHDLMIPVPMMVISLTPLELVDFNT